MMDFETWYYYIVEDEKGLEKHTLKELLEETFIAGAEYQKRYTDEDNAISEELDDINFVKNHPEIFKKEEIVEPFEIRHKDIIIELYKKIEESNGKL